MLEARKLSAGYGRVPVVRDLDLHVAAGEVVSLVGPNGAGKTTTLLALAVAAPFSGTTAGSMSLAAWPGLVPGRSGRLGREELRSSAVTQRRPERSGLGASRSAPAMT